MIIFLNIFLHVAKVLDIFPFVLDSRLIPCGFPKPWVLCSRARVSSVSIETLDPMILLILSHLLHWLPPLVHTWASRSSLICQVYIGDEILGAFHQTRSPGTCDPCNPPRNPAIGNSSYFNAFPMGRVHFWSGWCVLDVWRNANSRD